MGYIGRAAAVGQTETVKDSFNGDNSTVAFTMSQSVSLDTDIEVFVGNVQQEPGSGKAYTVSGTTLTFSEAPPTGTGNIYVIHRNSLQGTLLPPQNLGDRNYLIGGNLSLDADSAVLNFGADSDINLTHVADTALLLNDAIKLTFRDSALSVNSSTDGQLDIDADTELEITAPTVDINASTAVTVSNDLKLDSDSAVLSFGTDSDITVTHVADTGLTLKNSATGDDNPFVLTLQTGETDIAQDDVLGQIDFQAPDEGTGTDAILKSASIQAVSEGDFSSSFNRTSLVLNTARSAAVGSAGDGGKLTLKSNGSMLLKDMRTDANAPSFILQTGSTNVAQDDVLGAIEFQAPDEGTGTDAILVAAGISAVSEGDFSSSSNATSLVFKTGSSETAAEKMRINSAGKVLVGTTASRSMFTVSPNFFIEGTGFDDSSMGIVTNRNDGNGGFLFLGKSKGTSLGSSTVVSSGNDLGAIAFAAADGSDMESIAAMIVGGISDDVSPGANDVPGTLKFATASDSGTSATHRMQIDQLGRIRVGSDGELKHRLVSQQTTGVGTSAATIATVGTFSTFGGHYFITGRNADSSASRFCDQLTAGLNGSINVLHSTTVRGSPASRSYSLSSENLQVAMGSGSNYTINVFAIDQITS